MQQMALLNGFYELLLTIAECYIRHCIAYPTHAFVTSLLPFVTQEQLLFNQLQVLLFNKQVC
jgi:hypothetical protein